MLGYYAKYILFIASLRATGITQHCPYPLHGIFQSNRNYSALPISSSLHLSEQQELLGIAHILFIASLRATGITQHCPYPHHGIFQSNRNYSALPISSSLHLSEQQELLSIAHILFMASFRATGITQHCPYPLHCISQSNRNYSALPISSSWHLSEQQELLSIAHILFIASLRATGITWHCPYPLHCISQSNRNYSALPISSSWHLSATGITWLCPYPHHGIFQSNRNYLALPISSSWYLSEQLELLGIAHIIFMASRRATRITQHCPYPLHCPYPFHGISKNNRNYMALPISSSWHSSEQQKFLDIARILFK